MIHPCRQLTLLMWFIVCPLAGAAESPFEVVLTAEPATPTIERLIDAQHLNFDLLVTNRTEVTLAGC